MTLRWHPRGLVLVLALLVSGCTAVDPGTAVAGSMPESFSPLVKRVLPAVVNISVTETISGGEVLNELPPELRDTPLGREFRSGSAIAGSRRWAQAPASSSIRRG